MSMGSDLHLWFVPSRGNDSKYSVMFRKLYDDERVDNPHSCYEVEQFDGAEGEWFTSFSEAEHKAHRTDSYVFDVWVDIELIKIVYDAEWERAGDELAAASSAERQHLNSADM